METAVFPQSCRLLGSGRQETNAPFVCLIFPVAVFINRAPTVVLQASPTPAARQK